MSHRQYSFDPKYAVNVVLVQGSLVTSLTIYTVLSYDMFWEEEMK